MPVGLKILSRKSQQYQNKTHLPVTGLKKGVCSSSMELKKSAITLLTSGLLLTLDGGGEGGFAEIVGGFVEVIGAPRIKVSKSRASEVGRHNTFRYLSRRDTIAIFVFACLVLDPILLKVGVIEVLLKRTCERNWSL